MPKKTKVAPRSVNTTDKVSIPQVGATTNAKGKGLDRWLKTLANLEGGVRVTITPEIATELLALNTSNRKVKRERIRLYASSMKRGQWQFTGDSIRIAKTDKGANVLVDGQHRLMACLEAGVSFETLLIGGLKASVFTVIDRGATRSNGDVLGIAGFKNGNTVGSTVRPVIALEAGLNPMMHGTLQLVTGDDILKFCEENKTLISWALALGEKGAKNVGGIKSAWGMFAILAAKARNKKIVEQFIDETSKGIGFYEGDPRLALRSFMLKTGTSYGATARNYREAGTIMRVFNAYIEGRKMAIVRPWGINTTSTFPQTTKARAFDWSTGTPADESDDA